MFQLNPRYNPPSLYLLKQKMEENYNIGIKSLISQLKTTSAISLTTDHWTSIANEPYIALTAHFIDEDFKLNQVLLSIEKTEQAHTSQNICLDLIKILDDFQIEKGKITSISSDSAHNISKALKLLGVPQVNCFAHMIHNAF